MDTETSKTYVFGNEGATVPAWMAMNNGGFGGFNGNTIGDLIGLAIVASIFGWNGGYGNRGGYGDRSRYGGMTGNRMDDDYDGDSNDEWREMRDMIGERRRMRNYRR